MWGRKKKKAQAGSALCGKERMPVRKIYCDRCGREVDREESRIVPSFTTWDVARYMRRKLPLEMQQLAGKDFCRDCIADIVDFALNGKACDECVQQMMEENAMLREADEEVGSDTLGETDPDEWNKALNRMESLNHLDESPC